MSDTDGKKPLGLGGGARGPGQVKQSFSHGRTKSVAVEVKRKRVVVPTKPGTPGATGGASGTATHLGDPSKRPAGITLTTGPRLHRPWHGAGKAAIGGSSAASIGTSAFSSFSDPRAAQDGRSRP